MKIQPNVDFLRQKKNLKNSLNDSKPSLKKSRKRLFLPTKWSEMTPQNGQNEEICNVKFQFSGSFINLQAENTPKSRPFKDKHYT